MTPTQEEILKEVLSVFEGAADANNKLYRTILAYYQQDTANRLREAFGLEKE